MSDRVHERDGSELPLVFSRAGQRFMRLYRLARTNPPTRVDFLSLAALGKPAPTNDREAARQWDGLSTYASAEQCRKRVRATPRGRERWQFIVALDLPLDGSVRIERTERRPGDGHHTIWGTPEVVMRYTEKVERV